jgi:hypothetical protein
MRCGTGREGVGGALPRFVGFWARSRNHVERSKTGREKGSCQRKRKAGKIFIARLFAAIRDLHITFRFSWQQPDVPASGFFIVST